MVQQGSIDVDQVTRTTRPTAAAQSRLVAANLSSSSLPHSLIKDKDKDKDGMVVVDGPTLVVESVHPYKHNTSEYSTVQVPGAVSYSVSFSDNTRTEAIYDFVRFYDDETHTHHFGSGKYSGGSVRRHPDLPLLIFIRLSLFLGQDERIPDELAWSGQSPGPVHPQPQVRDLFQDEWQCERLGLQDAHHAAYLRVRPSAPAPCIALPSRTRPESESRSESRPRAPVQRGSAAA